MNRLLHEICLNAILVLIRLLSIRSVHVLVHFLDIVLELIKARIIITLIGDFLNLVLALFELFVVTIFIAISVDRTSDTADESLPIDHSLGEVKSISLVKLSSKVAAEIFQVVHVILHDHILGSEVDLLLVA